MTVLKRFRKKQLEGIIQFTHYCLLLSLKDRSHVPDPSFTSEYLDFVEFTVNKVTTKTPVPKHVALLVLQDALKRRDVCPVTLEPLKSSATCDVTRCGHVFSSLDNIDLCPMCREDVSGFARLPTKKLKVVTKRVRKVKF